MAEKQSDVDELSELLASDSVSLTPNSTARDHPRFAQYKNTSRADDAQQRRRLEYLERQKNARFNYANHARKLALNEFDEDDELMESESMEVDDGDRAEKEGYGKRKKNRYANELMTSEWLIDIPESLSTDWILVPCPVGRRCLVIACGGVTTLYSKSGYLLKQCVSYLPGGGRSTVGDFTLLDCILCNETSTLYCLDLIAWNGISEAKNEFECRLFLLNSRITENKNFQETAGLCPYRFLCLPYCRCERKLMEEMMQREFQFEIDGLLFYHSGVYYRSGQSPLVGWLKPWMLPEILHVEVPEKFLKDADVTSGGSQRFIETYNQTRGHKSQFSKNTGSQ